MIKIFIFKIIVLSSISAVYSDEGIDLTFPSEFLIGTATSAYQVEGAWNVDVKQRSESSYYHSILDELEKQQITPFVTIYHWDHPQVLEKIGGWLNEEMPFTFADYEKFIFKEYGSRLKVFTTVNEPNIFCSKGYGSTVFAPGVNLTEYLCVQNLLKARALAYHAYHKNFREEQKGVVGLVASCNYCSPKTKNDTN